MTERQHLSKIRPNIRVHALPWSLPFPTPRRKSLQHYHPMTAWHGMWRGVARSSFLSHVAAGSIQDSAVRTKDRTGGTFVTGFKTGNRRGRNPDSGSSSLRSISSSFETEAETCNRVKIDTLGTLGHGTHTPHTTTPCLPCLPYGGGWCLLGTVSGLKPET